MLICNEKLVRHSFVKYISLVPLAGLFTGLRDFLGAQDEEAGAILISILVGERSTIAAGE